LEGNDDFLPKMLNNVMITVILPPFLVRTEANCSYFQQVFKLISFLFVHIFHSGVDPKIPKLRTLKTLKDFPDS